MALNETEFAIVTARVMFGEDWESALQWLKDTRKIEMTKATFYRVLGRLSVEAKSRMRELARKFSELHMQEIDKFHILESQMFQDLYKIEDPFKRIQAAKTIIEIQPYITSLVEATRYVLEDDVKNTIKEDSILSKFNQLWTNETGQNDKTKSSVSSGNEQNET